MLRVLLKKLTREVIMGLCFFLPADKKRRLERWLRGREEFRKLQDADLVVVSFGKSGRTWLRVMMSRFYQVRYGLPESKLIGFDNFHRANAAIPKMFFTHDNYLRDYTGNLDNKRDFYGKKVVLLMRNPGDVAVSQFFQWKFRMRKAKKALNEYPDHDANVEVADFVLNHPAGLDKVMDFMNGWARELPNLSDVLIVRYEDMRSNPEHELTRLFNFVGSEPKPDEIAEAVRFASIDNMRKMEEKKVFWLSGSRMTPKDKSNPNSYKVRRAKVGGYRDYFTDEEVIQLNGRMRDDLDAAYGYRFDDDATPVKMGA